MTTRARGVRESSFPGWRPCVEAARSNNDTSPVGVRRGVMSRHGLPTHMTILFSSHARISGVELWLGDRLRGLLSRMEPWTATPPGRPWELVRQPGVLSVGVAGTDGSLKVNRCTRRACWPISAWRAGSPEASPAGCEPTSSTPIRSASPSLWSPPTLQRAAVVAYVPIAFRRGTGRGTLRFIARRRRLARAGRSSAGGGVCASLAACRRAASLSSYIASAPFGKVGVVPDVGGLGLQMGGLPALADVLLHRELDLANVWVPPSRRSPIVRSGCFRYGSGLAIASIDRSGAALRRRAYCAYASPDRRRPPLWEASDRQWQRVYKPEPSVSSRPGGTRATPTIQRPLARQARARSHREGSSTPRIRLIPGAVLALYGRT